MMLQQECNLTWPRVYSYASVIMKLNNFQCLRGDSLPKKSQSKSKSAPIYYVYIPS